MEEHFRNIHKSCDKKLSSEKRNEEKKSKQTKITAVCTAVIFSGQTSKAKAATEASFRVSHSIVKHNKSFQDGEMIKETFVEAADSFWD